MYEQETAEQEEVDADFGEDNQALEESGFQRYLLEGQAYVRRPQWAVMRAAGGGSGVYCWRCGMAGHIQRFCRMV